MKRILMTFNLIAITGVSGSAAAAPGPQAQAEIKFSPISDAGDAVVAKAVKRLQSLVRRLDSETYKEVDHRVVHQILGELPINIARSVSGARYPAEASMLGDMARSLQTEELTLWRRRWLAGEVDEPLGTKGTKLKQEIETFIVDVSNLIGLDPRAPETFGSSEEFGMAWRPLELRDSLNAAASACDTPHGKIPDSKPATRPAGKPVTKEGPGPHRGRFGLDILDRFGGLIERVW